MLQIQQKSVLEVIQSECNKNKHCLKSYKPNYVESKKNFPKKNHFKSYLLSTESSIDFQIDVEDILEHTIEIYNHLNDFEQVNAKQVSLKTTMT